MHPKSIIVGVDDSPESAAAALVGCKLSRLTRTPCRLVHALADLRPTLASVALPALGDEPQRRLEAVTARSLRARLPRSLPREVVQSLVVRTGPAPAVLATEVERHNADLVILGGKRHTALGRWTGGSTALDAARLLDVPVLVVKGAPAAFQRILVAVDLSAAAPPTLAAAERIAGAFGGRLRAVHALEPLPVLANSMWAIDPRRYYDEERAALERSIWPLIETPTAERTFRFGPVITELATEVDQWEADLLVVGSHGKGWVDRLLLGSVTQYLINHLPCSLLVVPVHAQMARRAATVARPARRAHPPRPPRPRRRRQPAEPRRQPGR